MTEYLLPIARGALVLSPCLLIVIMALNRAPRGRAPETRIAFALRRGPAASPRGRNETGSEAFCGKGQDGSAR